jgi:hypothetical protein
MGSSDGRVRAGLAGAYACCWPEPLPLPPEFSRRSGHVVYPDSVMLWIQPYGATVVTSERRTGQRITIRAAPKEREEGRSAGRGSTLLLGHHKDRYQETVLACVLLSRG